MPLQQRHHSIIYHRLFRRDEEPLAEIAKTLSEFDAAVETDVGKNDGEKVGFQNLRNYMIQQDTRLPTSNFPPSDFVEDAF